MVLGENDVRKIALSGENSNALKFTTFHTAAPLENAWKKTGVKFKLKNLVNFHSDLLTLYSIC